MRPEKKIEAILKTKKELNKHSLFSKKKRGTGPEDTDWSPSLPLLSCVTLGKLWNFSEPQQSSSVKWG